MQYLSSLFFNNPRPRYPLPSLETKLIGTRVLLRVGDPADWHNWRTVREASRHFLTPWEPAWSTQALSYNYFCGQLHRHWREWRSGLGYAFQICLLPDTWHVKDDCLFDAAGSPVHNNDKRLMSLPIIGGIALNDVARGIAQKGTLGYWIGTPYVRQGLMTEAASLVCSFAFDVLKLHRVEAACLPHNEPSKNLLHKLGFTEEGVAQDYLKINGAWATHLLWGKVAKAVS